MIDLSKQKIDVNCESCKKTFEITLGQVAREETVKCNCGQSIKLEDSNGQSKKTIQSVNQRFKTIQKTLDGLGS